MTISIPKSNAKLGKISSFSLPPGRTCPGMSDVCKTLCYVDKFYRQYPSVRGAYATNWEATESDTFVDDMVAKIHGMPSCRQHVSGDFYSHAYIDQWLRIVEACPDTKFWGYTRSWNTDLVDHLELLRSRPNVQLFASWDESMPEPPIAWRKAYIGGTDKAYDCPEQDGRKADCKACQYCFLGKKGNARFQIH